MCVSKIVTAGLHLLKSINKSNFYIHAWCFLPYAHEVSLLQKGADNSPDPNYFLGLLGCKAESLNLPERSGHELAAGLYISPNPSKTITMFSMSPTSRTAFLALSAVQVTRLQMFVFRCPWVCLWVTSSLQGFSLLQWYITRWRLWHGGRE